MNGEDNDQVPHHPEDKASEQIEESESAPHNADKEEAEIALSDFELSELIENLCLSKVEEFVLLGYEHVTGKEIWDCVSDKYRKTGVPSLHQIVNDILSLKSTQFMNWLTISMYRGAQF
ncbi:post-transcriptional regulator [Paenibacillus sp. MAH-36]|uniref:Post-transcriptional regulator n=2 Tax=Paenibacillus TaxID=44249 RepID=A0ABU3RGU3_9BACL|nr:post-transcriptional regulator [Paenibacillus sp. PFR10]MDU0203467.1 post-transcriptional regulator [Paenibacillus sp. PFR10]